MWVQMEGWDWRPLPLGPAAFAETAPSHCTARHLCGTSPAVRMRVRTCSRARALRWAAGPPLHSASLSSLLCLDGLEVRGFESSKLVLFQKCFLDSSCFACPILCQFLKKKKKKVHSRIAMNLEKRCGKS